MGDPSTLLLGTVANWEQHLLPDLLEKPEKELAQLLGEDLPADAQPDKIYRGPTRVIVPTLRSCVTTGEELILKVIILSEAPPRDAVLHWRTLGHGRFTKASLFHVARGVWTVRLPSAAADSDLEYYVRVIPENGQPVFFPATAPTMNQTLVSMAAMH